MKYTKILGITGPTGAGKTLASRYFLENFKGKNTLIDADVISKEILEKDINIQNQILNIFGKKILKNNIIDRKLLAEQAFKTTENLHKLNKIMLPKITEKIKFLIDGYTIQKYDIIILDAPLLFNTPLFGLCDIILAILSPKEIRLERILSREKINIDQILKRMQAQNKDSFFKMHSDLFIINDGNIENFNANLENFAKKLTETLNETTL